MRVASENVAVLGEGPLWHAGERVVYWVDILRDQVLRYDPETRETSTVAGDRMVTALAEATDGELVLVANGTIVTLSGGKGAEIGRVDLPPGVRTNDGKCDPDGRLWFGTMDLEAGRPLGELMVFDGSVRRVFDRVTISNGLGWSPDGDVFYHVDSNPGLIYRHRYDLTTGMPTDRKVLADLTDLASSPDGLAVDVNGNLWVAMWDGWALFVFDSEGRKIEEVSLRVQRPTSVAFGGADLSDLYITTATVELGPSDLESQPDAGKLLVDDPGTRGLPVGRFRIGDVGVH